MMCACPVCKESRELIEMLLSREIGFVICAECGASFELGNNQIVKVDSCDTKSHPSRSRE